MHRLALIQQGLQSFVHSVHSFIYIRDIGGGTAVGVRGGGFYLRWGLSKNGCKSRTECTSPTGHGYQGLKI